ncbi:MAG: ABC transporter [Anaerolineae bacterium CG_4_9_14_3_um_filter_57_17]|nr:ABC transporter ATP-binding protein [bacterium]NCT21197.1 ABC transporter ATP-binding protein [bacterium]OIO84231.1 MAG: ABC transporter [Anaerolineae bacterium CG2_30_57_67]PJB68575.1 MAG: ABC transporter [Anaerolineae bacterium CG_4_9_14_3_um_filter_57_17]
MPIFSIENLSITFRDEQNAAGLHALGPVTFSVAEREFVCVLGPSGSGKSTLLRALAGLIQPSAGTIHFQNQQAAPRVGFVFQQATLMPWRSVLENILLPLEVEHLPAAQACQKAQEMAALVGLTGFENALPRDLSGGMAQRVALARALIHDPDLLLLDEPFGSLDALTREKMWGELSRLWQARQTTVLMVTHSISEALFLADRVLLLSARPGRIKLDLPVTLPRPRSEEMRYTPAFGALAKQLKQAIE